MSKVKQLIAACLLVLAAPTSFATSITFDFTFGEGDFLFNGTIGFPVDDGEFVFADRFELFSNTLSGVDLSTDRGGGPQLAVDLVEGEIVGVNIIGPIGPTLDGPLNFLAIFTGTFLSDPSGPGFITVFNGPGQAQGPIDIDPATLVFTPVVETVAAVPLPAGIWLFLTGLLGLAGRASGSRIALSN